jgi:SatD family protein
MPNLFIALIADAVASRRLAGPARDRLQARLRAAMPGYTRRWRRHLAAAFAVTLGDEVQCLLADVQPLWEIVHQLRLDFTEVEWIVACGRGALATRIPRGAAAPELDGPCFHAARGALEAAKRPRLLFTFAGFGPGLEPFAHYYSALYWSWTPRQRRTATLLRLGSPAAAATALRVDRSAVSHLARRMAWPLVAAGDKMFREAILEPR